MLSVHPDARYLRQADGQPFFWLGDTAWELLHRLNREETLHYLRDRAAKGFRVIQTVCLAELNGLDDPNAAGELCLHDHDPARPNPDYFTHVDWVLDQAESLGLYLALLPTWGCYVGDQTWPKDRLVFTAENAEAYGLFVGQRYAERPNLVWVLGGDRPCRQPETLAIWQAMATGIRAGGARQLITWHPPGGCSSAEFVHDENWLDFNMVQSSHFRKACENWRFIGDDRARKPRKPTLEAEPCYEEMPLGFNPSQGVYFDAYDVRLAAYWSVFAGSCGFTYGCQAVWQMWTPDRPQAAGTVLRPWKESLQLPGAGQMRHLRALVESRPYFARRPDPSLLHLAWPCSLGATNHVAVCRDGDDDGVGTSYLMAYSPILPLAIKLKTSLIPSSRLRVWAFDPREGLAYSLGDSSNTGTIPLPPMEHGMDWVYVVEGADAPYPPPGSGPWPY